MRRSGDHAIIARSKYWGKRGGMGGRECSGIRRRSHAPLAEAARFLRTYIPLQLGAYLVLDAKAKARCD